MDIKMYIDKQCGYNFVNALDEYEEVLKSTKYDKHKSKLIIVFSNNFDYIKEICKIYPKPNVVINVTENLSEYHVSNALKYVSDICYLKSDVKTVANRIIKTYTRLTLKEGKI